jgi:hypothetical protein
MNGTRNSEKKGTLILFLGLLVSLFLNAVKVSMEVSIFVIARYKGSISATNA